MPYLIHYWCPMESGLIVGTGSRGFSDDGFGRVVIYPAPSGRPWLSFDSRQAAIDWLKREVRPDTVIADNMVEFLAAKVPTVYIERVKYRG